jgi:hypothetical protein
MIKERVMLRESFRRHALVVAAVGATAAILGCGGGAGEPATGAGGGGATGQGGTTTSGMITSSGAGSPTGAGGASGVGGGGPSSSSATTATSSTGAGAGGSAFDPHALPGVELWLVGDDATADAHGNVSKWTDESDLHNDATPTMNPALDPTLVADAPGFNGHGVVRFRPCSELDVLDHGQGPTFDTRTDSYIAVVTSFNGASGPAYLFSKQKAYPGYSGVFGFNVVPPATPSGLALMIHRPPDESYSAASNTFYDDTVPRLYTGKMRNGQLVVSVNGVVVATGASTPTEEFVDGATASIGASSGGACFSGDVAEMFIIGNPSADTDGLEAWLKAKYGL